MIKTKRSDSLFFSFPGSREQKCNKLIQPSIQRADNTNFSTFYTHRLRPKTFLVCKAEREVIFYSNWVFENIFSRSQEAARLLNEWLDKRFKKLDSK